MAPHFAKTRIADSEFFDGVEDWVKLKLKGRYAVFKSPYFDSASNTLKSALHIGFEDPQELTYFMLACPHLRRT